MILCGSKNTAAVIHKFRNSGDRIGYRNQTGRHGLISGYALCVHAGWGNEDPIVLMQGCNLILSQKTLLQDDIFISFQRRGDGIKLFSVSHDPKFQIMKERLL